MFDFCKMNSTAKKKVTDGVRKLAIAIALVESLDYDSLAASVAPIKHYHNLSVFNTVFQ